MTLDQMRDAVIVELVDLTQKAYLEGYCHGAIEYERPNLPNMDEVLAKAGHDWNNASMSKSCVDLLK